MFRACVVPNCTRYAVHRVSTRPSGLDIQCCQGHLPILVLTLDRVVPRDRLEVVTQSAVVVGDLREWRTRSITAYDGATRQIGA